MHSPYPFESEVEALHSARSRFLDAYAAVEAAICLRLFETGVTPGNRSVGQRIEALRAVKASPRYSKSERKRVHEVLQRLEAENEVRCDIVHAALKVVHIDGQSVACFVNPRQLGQTTTVARHVSVEQFDRLIADLMVMAKALNG